MLKFHSFPGTIGLACQVALEDAEAPYELVPVNLRQNEQRGPDYLALNPKSRVPVLETERGVLSEAPAILLYIAQAFPAAKLAPLDDPWAMAQVQSFNTYLCATVHVAAAHGIRGYRWADDQAAIAEMKRKAPEVVTGCFRLIEDTIFQGPFVMGGAYTICDPYLFTLSGWLERDGIDRAQFPKVSAHFERMAARANVRKVLAEWEAWTG